MNSKKKQETKAKKPEVHKTYFIFHLQKVLTLISFQIYSNIHAHIKFIYITSKFHTKNVCIGILRHCCPRPSGVIIDTQDSHNISLDQLELESVQRLSLHSIYPDQALEATGLPELLDRWRLLCLNVAASVSQISVL